MQCVAAGGVIEGVCRSCWTIYQPEMTGVVDPSLSLSGTKRPRAIGQRHIASETEKSLRCKFRFPLSLLSFEVAIAMLSSFLAYPIPSASVHSVSPFLGICYVPLPSSDHSNCLLLLLLPLAAGTIASWIENVPSRRAFNRSESDV